MKVTAIIAEYNPFHNGHAYQIARAKELTGADAVIIVMSGNFVQRGTPAIFDKYTRAQMAILNGADLVLELPCVFATGSAEYFAMGAVSLLESLGIVDSLLFGAECDSIEDILLLTKELLSPAECFQKSFTTYCKEGMSFPVARAKALHDSLLSAGTISSQDLDRFDALLMQPNNILALEYCKAISITKSSMQPILLQRTTANYHSASLENTYCSATALRKEFLQQDSKSATPKEESMILHSITNYVPTNLFSLYQEMLQSHRYLSELDVSLATHLSLFSDEKNDFSNYLDVSKELSNKIKKERNQYTDFSSFCNRLKSKDLTYTRISRSLTHILLGIRKDMVPSLDLVRSHYDAQTKGHPLAFYARPLAMSQTGATLLSGISKKGTIPLINKVSDWEEIVTTYPYLTTCQATYGKKNFALDLTAAHKYEAILTSITHAPITHEYQRMLKPTVRS